MTTSDRIRRIARELWISIPQPPRKRERPRASWHQLKPGQWLTTTGPRIEDGTTYPAGTLWQVAEVRDAGAKLTTVDGAASFWIMDPEWKANGAYKRARKPKRA
jgi:hypothetical protein